MKESESIKYQSFVLFNNHNCTIYSFKWNLISVFLLKQKESSTCACQLQKKEEIFDVNVIWMIAYSPFIATHGRSSPSTREHTATICCKNVTTSVSESKLEEQVTSITQSSQVNSPCTFSFTLVLNSVSQSLAFMNLLPRSILTKATAIHKNFASFPFHRSSFILMVIAGFVQLDRMQHVTMTAPNLHLLIDKRKVQDEKGESGPVGSFNTVLWWGMSVRMSSSSVTHLY